MQLAAAASISVMNNRIDFFCARAEHQAFGPDDALTMHEERWAYCAAGATEPHEWYPMAIGGMSLDDAKQFIRQRSMDPVDVTDQRSD
jgi:hypothetical protein